MYRGVRDSKGPRFSLACGVFVVSAACFVIAGPRAARAGSTGDPQWNVRVEVLMVAMPQDKLLPLLPDLRDPAKIDAAVDQLLAAVQRKEAILTGYPVVYTLDGERGVSEAVLEKRYPTEFNPPAEPQNFGGSGTPTPAEQRLIDESPIPSAFETRNCGTTLEVYPHVVNHGGSIRLDLEASARRVPRL